MPTKGTILTILAALTFAFAWGYKRDDLLAYWRAFNEPPKVEAPPPVASVAEVPVAPPVQPPAVPPTRGNAAAQANMMPPVAPPVHKQEELTNTLDSIRPTQIQPEAITQRNAYFEKLSQQLKELQGGAPNSAPNPDPGAVPPPPPPPIEAPPPGEAPAFPGSIPGGQPPGVEAGLAPQPLIDLDQQTPTLEDDETEDEEPESDAEMVDEEE